MKALVFHPPPSFSCSKLVLLRNPSDTNTLRITKSLPCMILITIQFDEDIVLSMFTLLFQVACYIFFRAHKLGVDPQQSYLTAPLCKIAIAYCNPAVSLNTKKTVLNGPSNVGVAQLASQGLPTLNPLPEVWHRSLKLGWWCLW